MAVRSVDIPKHIRGKISIGEYTCIVETNNGDKTKKDYKELQPSSDRALIKDVIMYYNEVLYSDLKTAFDKNRIQSLTDLKPYFQQHVFHCDCLGYHPYFNCSNIWQTFPKSVAKLINEKLATTLYLKTYQGFNRVGKQNDSRCEAKI